jgi:hypothetical protein
VANRHVTCRVLQDSIDRFSLNSPHWTSRDHFNHILPDHMNSKIGLRHKYSGSIHRSRLRQEIALKSEKRRSRLAERRALLAAVKQSWRDYITREPQLEPSLISVLKREG